MCVHIYLKKIVSDAAMQLQRNPSLSTTKVGHAETEIQLTYRPCLDISTYLCNIFDATNIQARKNLTS